MRTLQAVPNRVLSKLLLMTLAIAISACGSYRVGETGQNGYQFTQDDLDGSINVPGLDDDDFDSGYDSGTGTEPVYTKRVGTVGYDEVKISVPVRRKLKVRFIPGAQDEKIKDTGFTPNYSKLSVTIQVGGLEKVTPLLGNGFASTYEEESQIYDFSNAFTKVCAEEDGLDCRQMVTITVKKPNYDYWCLNFGYYCDPGHTHVYDTHPWHGFLEVQTDDTVSLQ